MPASPVLAELRVATARLHEAVEAESGVEAAMRDLASRASAVGRFLSLHQAVDQGVEPWRGALRSLGHVVEARSGLIRDDLARLGAEGPGPCNEGGPATLGEALGWIYVAEGSVLGGRKMRRDMAADGVPLTGLDFLDPHGDATASRWRTFLSTMEEACASGEASQADVIRGGLDAFRLAHTLLVPPCPDKIPE